MNHEEVWNNFFQGVDPSCYSIYIHYKENKPLMYFDQYKLPHCRETAWGEISLVQAQNLLLEEGLKDRENTNFIFLSNSCIPLKAFDEIYSHVRVDMSYFNFFPPGQCFPLCNRVLTFIDARVVQKAHQWCILNRKHAALMLELAVHFLTFRANLVP